MGLLICEPKATTHVSGTVLLDQQAAHSEAVTAGLKHGKGKDAHIVLAPQPSEDPNDPLNWNSLKKLRVMVITYFGVIVHGVVPVSAYLHIRCVFGLTRVSESHPERRNRSDIYRSSQASHRHRSSVWLPASNHGSSGTVRISFRSEIWQKADLSLLINCWHNWRHNR